MSKFISKYLSPIISVSKLNCLVNIIKQSFKCGVIAGANNTKESTIDPNERKKNCQMTLEESRKDHETTQN